MRTREQILNSLPELHQKGAIAHMVELLLDIRDILLKKEKKEKPKK